MLMKEPLIRRDYLAYDRTKLANERTILAYWRTALAFFALAGVLIKFYPTLLYITISVLALIFGFGLFFFGTSRYFKYERKIRSRMR